MDLANHNLSYAPKNWHDVVGSKSYDQKINLTRFFKALFDCPQDEIEHTIYKFLHIYPDKKNYDSVYKQASHLLQYLVWVPKESCYELLWDFDLSTVSDSTLIEFNQIHKLQLHKSGTIASEEDIRKIEDLLSKIQNEPKDEDYSDDDDESDAHINLVEFFDENWKDGLPENLLVKHIAPVIRILFPDGQHESGFAAPQLISPLLQEFLKLPAEINQLARTDVTRRMIEYIKKHGLEDKKDPRIIHPDAAFEKIVGTEAERLVTMERRKEKLLKIAQESSSQVARMKADKMVVSGELTYFNLQVHLNEHFDEKSETFRKGWKPVLQQIREFNLASLKAK